MISDDDVKGRVSQNLRAAMRILGWTQQRLAETAGIPLMTANRMIRGENVPSVANLHRIAEALGTTMDHLVSAPHLPAQKKARRTA